MRIFYPLNPDDAPTAAELAADEAEDRRRNPEGADFTLADYPYDPTEPF